MKNSLLALAFILIATFSYAQIPSSYHPSFPQTEINSVLNGASKKNCDQNFPNKKKSIPAPASPKSILSILSNIRAIKERGFKMNRNGNSINVIDTVYVGGVPNDTMIITGTWIHSGPIFVFNDGVLIFQNANVTNTGEVYVFGYGKLFADSSLLTFPQQYFYERSLIAVEHGYAHFQNCSFNYSGYSHNLVLGDSAVVEMDNVHQNDWTTCGLFGFATLNIHGCNLGGEYILSDKSTTTFNNVDTIILWHQFPDSAVVNYSFPPGDTVSNYVFNDTIPGINGIAYKVNVDSCHLVSWAMMPVNGSDVTISNSTIRAIGAWFQHGDTASVSGVVDNSTYTNYVMPVSDRNLHLINSSVQTWSLYAFDSSQISISNCQLGEVGCQQSSSVLSTQFLLDGSGGYFWATDTSAIIASGVTVYSTARSERNGIFILGYSWLPFSGPSAIGNSLIICVQSGLAQDPVPYDASVAWLEVIWQPDTAFNDSIVAVTGSAWIDHGPLGGWMDFGNYSLYYQLQGAATWNIIVSDSLNEIHANILGQWNTYGLAPGNYFLKLVVKNNFTDSVEAIKPVTLLQSTVSTEEYGGSNFSATVFPNPSIGNLQLDVYSDINSSAIIEFTTVFGEKIIEKQLKIVTGKNAITIGERPLSPGIYYYQLTSNNHVLKGKIVVQ